MPSCVYQLFMPLWFMKQACTPSYTIYSDLPWTSQRALITSLNESQHVRLTCLKMKAELLSIESAAVRITEIRNIKKIWAFFGISAGGTNIQMSGGQSRLFSCISCIRDSHSGAAGAAKKSRKMVSCFTSGVIFRQLWINLLKSANNKTA